MAAPSIPNLLTLKTGNRRADQRGARERPAAAPTADAAIQATDTDAAVSRLSAVRLGYLQDEYAALFVSGPPTRRLPIINRGTYMRTTALDTMIDAFFSHNDSSPVKQIISLGAGTDTRPLHLLQRPASQQQQQQQQQHLVYHELDFEPTCRRKLATTQASSSLRCIFKDFSLHDDGSWSAEPSYGGGEYHCHALDLRQIGKSVTSLPPTIRSDVPTLLLSECCLCYLTSRDADDVLRFFGARIARLAALLYEPMPLGDTFGDMMISNLRARRIHMPSLDVCRDQPGQVSRLRRAGFERAGSATIEKTWEEWVGTREKERVDGLEGLDEVEEWKLLAGHYVVVWGSRGDVTFGMPDGGGHIIPPLLP